MLEHAPPGALRGAFAFHHTLYNWYQEKTFWLYYYGLSYDPKEIVCHFPLSPALTEKLTLGVDAVRSNILSSAASRIAGGDEAKPTFGNVWTGLMAHMQNGLRPALDIALRTGMNSPMRFSLLAVAAALMLVDVVYGGPVTQAVASFNSESNRPAEIKSAMQSKKSQGKRATKTASRPDGVRLSAQPSFS